MIKQFYNILLISLFIFISACASQSEKSRESSLILAQDNTVYVFSDDETQNVTGEHLQLQLDMELQGPPRPNWVNRSRYYVADTVGGVTEAVDSYISEDDTVTKNNSYLRLRIGKTWQDGGNFIDKIDVKLKADFPKSKDKIGIIFETSPEEFETLEQQNRESGTGDQLVRDGSSSTAALRFVLQTWRSWQSDLDAGIKGVSPVNPFLRLRFSKTFAISEQWRLLSNNALYLYYQDGYASQSSISFIRPFSQNFVFVNKQEVRWLHDRQVLSFANISSVTHAYAGRQVFTYRAGAFYEQKPEPYLSSYFVDFSYRQRLHEDWLYLELIPSLTWSEEYAFERVAELTLRFEMYFRN